jgi:heme exporter protein CcmB
MTLFRIFLQQELLILFKNKAQIYANIIYFLIFFSVFQIISQNFSQDIQNKLLILNITLNILFAIINICQNIFIKDHEDGTLEQYIIHINNIEIFILAKIIANWIASCLLIVLFCGLYFKYNNFVNLELFKILLILGVSSLSLTFIFAWSSCLSIIEGLSPAVIILALPVTLPIIIFTNLALGDQFNDGIIVLSAFLFFIGSVTTLANAKIIKIANN